MRDTDRVPIDAAGEHYVLYMLYRLGIDAALLPSRTPIGDIVLFDREGGIGGWIQVKTSSWGRSGWRMGKKNEEARERLWYALVDLDERLRPGPPRVCIVPSEVVARALRQDHERWLRDRSHKDSDIRKLRSPFPYRVDPLPDFTGDWLKQYEEDLGWRLLPGYPAAG